MTKEAVNIIGKEPDGRWSECHIGLDDIRGLIGQTKGFAVAGFEKFPHFRRRTYTSATITLSTFDDLKQEPESTIEDEGLPKKEVIWSAKLDSPATVENITNAASRKHH